MKELFAVEKPYKTLGFPDEGGVTGYFGRNLNQKDLKLVEEFVKSKDLELLNTRAFKKEGKFGAPNRYTITVGSIDTSKTQKDIKFKNALFDLEYGEFSAFLQDVNRNLEKALEFAANDNEKTMVKKYIEHFKSGDISVHKDSQRAWIKDKSPIVESNLGWIEHYVDPSNKRALWDGWVAIVDKERSKKFQHLVANAKSVIDTMPWPKAWEKDTFIAPDFTSLDIVSFGGDAMPKGINIPNYNEIRENEGFKNVIFEDNKPKNRSLWEPIDYVTPEESHYMHENSKEAYRVMVAGHELFGHGSGKQI